MRQTSRFLLFCFLVSSHLSAVRIVTNPDPVLTANAITDVVTGADLTGLVVTATYGESSGALELPMTWIATGPASGKASNGNVSVSVSGGVSDSLAWRYNSIFLGPLISLRFDGAIAGIYFDRQHSGPGTPGSGIGADISFGPLYPQGIDNSIIVTYSKAVALVGAQPQNDLYADMFIQFPNSIIGQANFPPQDLAFTQNTDQEVVPEPASWLMLSCGLAFLLIKIRTARIPTTL